MLVTKSLIHSVDIHSKQWYQCRLSPCMGGAWQRHRRGAPRHYYYFIAVVFYSWSI